VTQAADRVRCRQTGLCVAHAALGDTDRFGDEPLAIGTGLEVGYSCPAPENVKSAENGSASRTSPSYTRRGVMSR